MAQEPAAKDEPMDCAPPESDIRQPQEQHSSPESSVPPLTPLPDDAKSTTIVSMPSPQQGPSGPPVIKTKLAVSRIKRIFKARRGAGKISKVVPAIVLEVLGRFMISLCEKASAQARCTKSRRVTTSHLKEVVLQGDQFNFLRDVVAKAPDLATLYPPQAGAMGGWGKGSR